MAPYNDSPGAGTRNGSPTGRGTGVGALAGGALFIGLIGLCALLISYNGIFRLAEYGHPRGGLLVHVFPVTYTLLLLMVCWTSYLLRDAPPRSRAWVDLALIPALVLFAGAVMVLNNLGMIESIPQRIANVIVAVAPLAALLTALLLWMAARAHIRRKRRTGGPRPGRSDDRSTAPPARTGVYDAGPPVVEDDGRSLEERLMGLELGPPATPPPPSEEDVRSRPEGDGAKQPVPETAQGEKPLSEPEESGPGAPEAESPVPAPPLPRRGGDGGNPIKEAAKNPPLAPIAAGPAPEPGESAEPVPTALVDEGFEHDPLPGDPVTDEAEAFDPAPVPGQVEQTGEAGQAVRDDAPDPATGPTPPDGPPVSVAERPEEETEEGAPAAEAPGEAFEDTPAFGVDWEPPEDDRDTWTRAEYVPPVWTPPEEDAPEEPEEVSAPVLDHDTGPTVRAAFRVPDAPVSDARPASPDVLFDDRPVWSPPADDPHPAEAGPGSVFDDVWTAATAARVPDSGSATATATAGEGAAGTPEADPGDEGEPRRPVPEESAAPGTARPFQDAGAEHAADPLPRRPELEKRPMVLKPPRPPMPDFASGPPSRRVRSEPLRPDE